MFSKIMSMAWLALAAVVVFVTTVLVDNYTSQPRAEEVTLRAYQVPEGRAQELKNALQSVLGGSKTNNENGHLVTVGERAKITVYNGQLLVTAPSSLHWSITSMLEKLTDAPVQQEKDAMIYDVWFVQAQTGKEGLVSEGLTPVEGVLAGVSTETGLNRFRLVDHTRLTAALSEGDMARREREGAGPRVEVFIHRRGEKLAIKAKFADEEVNAMLLPVNDKSYVLGISGAREMERGSNGERLLVLFRARTETATP